METNREQNEFNAAVRFANHLEDTFLAASIMLAELDIFNCYHTLGALVRMLSGEMNDSEITEFNNYFFGLKDSVNSFVAQQNKGKFQIPSDLLEKLHILEQKLRKIYRDSGLQSKIREDARAALK